MGSTFSLDYGSGVFKGVSFVKVLLENGEIIDERRRKVQCTQHEKLADDINFIRTDLAVTKNEVVNLSRRINGALEGIKDHIEHAGKWRTVIFSTAVSLVIILMTGVFGYGVVSNRVEENYRDVEKLIVKIDMLANRIKYVD